MPLLAIVASIARGTANQVSTHNQLEIHFNISALAAAARFSCEETEENGRDASGNMHANAVHLNLISFWLQQSKCNCTRDFFNQQPLLDSC